MEKLLADSNVAYQKFGIDFKSIRDRSEQQINNIHLPMLLKWLDRNSMAHSIESRVPYLDHKLVEYAINLPAKQKIHDGNNKAILRDVMKNKLPDDIVARTDKISFDTSETEWFKNDREQIFQGLIEETSEMTKSIINSNIFDVYQNNLIWYEQVWRAVCFSLW